MIFATVLGFKIRFAGEEGVGVIRLIFKHDFYKPRPFEIGL